MLKKAVLTVPGEKGDFHSLEVQYNPSTLNLSVSARSAAYENPQTHKMHDQVDQNTDSGELTLSFDLVIDDDGGRDVRKTLQGFLGMMFQESSRKIAFGWGDMNFEGSLEHINASFDMFDSNGTPVRGKVHMEIAQRDFKGVVNDELRQP